MEPWLCVRQADALTAGQMMLTHVFSYLLAILIILLVLNSL